MKTKKFAEDYNIYKLIWVFFIYSFLGTMIVMIWCYVVMGKLMSCSSLVYGQFSIVWGFGCVLLTILFHHIQNQKERYIFNVGVMAGGFYEYICSIIAEYFLVLNFGIIVIFLFISMGV